MLGCCNNSAKTYVLGEEVAWVTRSAAARGELADLARAMKGARALMALDWSMTDELLQ